MKTVYTILVKYYDKDTNKLIDTNVSQEGYNDLQSAQNFCKSRLSIESLQKHDDIYNRGLVTESEYNHLFIGNNIIYEIKEVDYKPIETNKCVICGKEYTGYGNNAEPVSKGRCCDKCNEEQVIPARLFGLSIKED